MNVKDLSQTEKDKIVEQHLKEKDRRQVYTKRRNMRDHLLIKKALDKGITVSDKEVEEAMKA